MQPNGSNCNGSFLIGAPEIEREMRRMFALAASVAVQHSTAVHICASYRTLRRIAFAA